MSKPSRAEVLLDAVQKASMTILGASVSLQTASLQLDEVQPDPLTLKTCIIDIQLGAVELLKAALFLSETLTERQFDATDNSDPETLNSATMYLTTSSDLPHKMWRLDSVGLFATER